MVYWYSLARLIVAQNIMVNHEKDQSLMKWIKSSKNFNENVKSKWMAN